MNIGKKIPLLVGILFILVAQFEIYAKASCRKSVQNLTLAPHTKLAQKQGSNGRVIKLLCDKGYFFSRGKFAAVVKCKNGIIKKPVPFCRGCDVPPDINNGTRNFSKMSLGSKVKYSCDVGFTLVGRRQRRCGKNFKWSGKVKTSCRRNRCAPKKLVLMNGNVTTTDPSNHELATLSFECNNKYELRGEEDIVCRDNKWSGRFPYCKKKRCPDPKQPNNGRRFGNNFDIGSTVQFFCKSGFTMYGSSKRTCQKDQTWNGSLTTCDDGRFYCRDPGIPISSRQTGNTYNLRNVVRYSCQTGFRLEGTNHRTCLSNKTWSGVQPKCVDKNHRVFPPINVTMRFLREGFVDSLLQTTCSGTNISCPTGDPRARSLLKKYKAGLDLIFVLDTSSSIKKKNFRIAKKFVKKIVSIFGVDGRRADGTKIACVTYGTMAQLEFNFRSALVRDLKKALKRIDKIVYTRGGTATRLALELVRDVVLPERRPGSTTALFLITDGNTNVGGDPNKVAKELRTLRCGDDLHDCGVEIYVVGVGKKVEHETLKRLASGEGDKEHVFPVENFDALEQVEEWIVKYSSVDYSRCGLAHYKSVDARARIIGGDVVKGRERWPWAVRVGHGDIPSCGGTLINDEYVLTAAHCLPKGAKASSIKVFYGDSKNTFFTSLGYHVHAGYVKKSFKNDIALVKIPKLLRYSKIAQAICLPQDLDMTNIIKTGDSLFLIGWGSTERTKIGAIAQGSSKDLRQIKIPFSDDKNCTDNIQRLEKLDKVNLDWYFNNNTQFCAADPSGQKDICNGDSGGPAMVLHQNPENGDVRWYQVGVVSWGNGCGQKGQYSYYTKVSAYLGWINSKIKS